MNNISLNNIEFITSLLRSDLISVTIKKLQEDWINDTITEKVVTHVGKLKYINFNEKSREVTLKFEDAPIIELKNVIDNEEEPTLGGNVLEFRLL